MAEPLSPRARSSTARGTTSEPSTPPASAQPQVNVMLPTPKSFGAHRIGSLKSPVSTASTTDSAEDNVTLSVPAASGRRVAFLSPLEEMMDPLASSRTDGQEQLVSPTNGDRPSAKLRPANTARKAPPSALNLSARPKFGLTAPGSATFSVFAPAAPVTAPIRAKVLVSTPSLPPGLSRAARNSTSGALYGPGSIWSAGFKPGASSGWRSPAPTVKSSLTATAAPNGGDPSPSARPRGLTAAVLKDGHEMIVGDVPVTPGLQSFARFGEAHEGEVSDEPSVGNSKHSHGKKPNAIILCRYFHTPGLTCTSRPCRFVHNLDAIMSPTIKGEPKPLFELRCPRTANEPAGGIFANAQAQLRAQAKMSSVQDIQEGKIQPGDTVLLGTEEGDEVKGTVFFMSGGGKGPGGNRKAKFKTVLCRDYAAGYCPYGSVCSFIHEERVPLSAALPPSNTVPPETVLSEAEVPTEPMSRRASEAVASSPASAEKRGHRRPKSMDISKSWASIVGTGQDENASLDNATAVVPPRAWDRPLSTAMGSLIVIKAPQTIEPKAEIAPASTGLLVQPPTPESEAIAELPSLNTKPRSSAWTKGSPKTLKKVLIDADFVLGSPFKPLSQHLGPPDSAMSLLTESDPATPWDPVLLRKKQEEAQADDAAHPEYSGPTAGAPPPDQPLSAPAHMSMWQPMAYPWGMPMTPQAGPDSQQPITHYPGGPGVMWTPAGWAVQDAAMKLALRTAEREALGRPVKPRPPKSYFRSKPCKFFADGFCPHGDDCTFLHVPDLSPDASATSDSDHLPVSPHHTGAGLPKHPNPHAHPRHRSIPCKFFNSAAGCSNGDGCAFLHVHVLPPEVPMVPTPRPWRTRPCRHFQLGRCILGDACHFAHVIDPQWIASGRKEHAADAARRRESTASTGSALTEDKLERLIKEKMRETGLGKDHGDSSDEDDLEVVTHVPAGGYETLCA